MDLNPQQARAATSLRGPMLVIAGAGSGKTRVIEARVAALLEEGVDPTRILLLTFTRRAAAQMLERVTRRQASAERVDGGTFHSFAYRMLVRHYRHVRLPRRPTIIDTDDAANAIASVVDRLGYDLKEGRLPSKRTLQAVFSTATNKRQALEEVVAEMAPDFVDRVDRIREVRRAYARYKLEQAYADYDDLLVFLLLLLKQPQVAPRIQGRYDHVLVDEYQDTNAVQGDIVTRMAEPHGNVMVVGDDAQGIYGFRGASHGNIMAFPELFDDAAIVTLETNYRSTQAILDAANAVLATMRERFEKRMTAAPEQVGDAGKAPRLNVFPDYDQETSWIADRLQQALEAGEELSRYAVLYRNAYLGIPLQGELIRRQIPFEVYGGQRLVDAAHVKDVLSYLRVVHNPLDELGWMRLLQLIRGIGAVRASRIFRAVTSGGNTLVPLDDGDNPFRRLDAMIDELSASAPYRSDLMMLAKALLGIAAKPTPAEMYEVVLKHYLGTVIKDRYDDHRSRKDDLEQLRVVLGGYRSLESLLADLTLDPLAGTQVATPPDDEPETSPVTLSTIHSAKGLEWPHVFVIGLSDGVLPSHRALATVDEHGHGPELEEEKRLLYVAMTRAQRELDLAFSLLAPRRGSVVMQELSRFLDPESVRATLERVEHQRPGAFSDDDVLDALAGEF